jgi:hypothetical protein
MATCVYHETTEAVATCSVCKQGICNKCLEFVQDGMCGMCVEIAAARKATNEANRAARPAVASSPNAVTGNTPRNAAPAARPSGPPAGTNSRGPSAPVAPPAKPAAKPGMCAEHPDQAAKASCSNCNKKVCPYCLDLYDLCSSCRLLPHCVRHESMVGSTRCGGCKMNFCKICLDGTDFCDRCRTLRQASGKSTKLAKPPIPATAGKTAPGSVAGKTAPGSVAGAPAAKLHTQGLQRTPTGTLPGKSGTGTGDRVAVGDRANAPQKGVQGKPAPKSKGIPTPAIAVAAVVILLIGWKVFFGGKPVLGEAEALAALQSEMKMVQHAAVALEAQNGAYPTTQEAIEGELKKEGIKTEDLPLPLKLSVNTPPTEALQIGYSRVGPSFEVRALDTEGRPLSDNGRDIILRPPPKDNLPAKVTS